MDFFIENLHIYGKVVAMRIAVHIIDMQLKCQVFPIVGYLKIRGFFGAAGQYCGDAASVR
jgi:hypothetical protein